MTECHLHKDAGSPSAHVWHPGQSHLPLSAQLPRFHQCTSSAVAQKVSIAHNLHSAVSNRNLRCKIRWRYLLVPTQPQSCVRTQYTLLIVFPQLLINLYQTSSIDDNCNCNYHHQNRQVSIEFRDLKANEQLTNPISWEISPVPKRILYCFSSIVKCDSGHNK